MKEFISYRSLWVIVPLFLVGLFLPNFATAQFTVDNYTFDQGPIVKKDAFYGGLLGLAGSDSKGYYVARYGAAKKLVVTAFDSRALTMDYFDKEMKPVGSFVLEEIYATSTEKSDKNSLEFFLNPPGRSLSAIYLDYNKEEKIIGLHYKEILSSQGELSNETTIAKFVLADEKTIPRGKFTAIYSPDSSRVALFGYEYKEFGKEDLFPAYVVVCNERLEPLWQKSFDLWDDTLLPDLQGIDLDPETAKLSNAGQLFLLGQAYLPGRSRKYVQDDKVQQRSFLFEVNKEVVKPYPMDVNGKLIGSLDMEWHQNELIVVGLGIGKKTYNNLFETTFSIGTKAFSEPLLLPLDEAWMKKYEKDGLTFRHIIFNEDGSFLLIGECGILVLAGAFQSENIILFDVSASGELRKVSYLEKEQRMTSSKTMSYLMLPGQDLALLYLNQNKKYHLGKYGESSTASSTDVFKYGDDEALDKYVLFTKESVHVNSKEKIHLAARLDVSNKVDYRLVRITAKE
jgi:hypothetical protein